MQFKASAAQTAAQAGRPAGPKHSQVFRCSEAAERIRSIATFRWDSEDAAGSAWSRKCRKYDCSGQVVACTALISDCL